MNTRTKRILLCGALLLTGAGVGVLAQEQPRPPTPRDRAAGGMREPGMARPDGARGARVEEAMERFKDQLQAENPAEYKRLMELREKDPEAFRNEIRARLAERGRGGMAGAGAGAGPGAGAMPAEEKACLDLARKYRETKDPAEAEKIKAELKAAVALAFDKRLERQKELLTALENRISTVRDQIQTRQGNKDKVCDLRVEELTRDANLNWGPE